MRKPRPLPRPLPLVRWRAPLIPEEFRISSWLRTFKADAQAGEARAGVTLGPCTLIWAEPWKDCTIAVIEDRWGYRAVWVGAGEVIGSARVPGRSADDPRARAWCIATADAAVRALRTVAPEPPPAWAEAWLRRRLAELDPTSEASA